MLSNQYVISTVTQITASLCKQNNLVWRRTYTAGTIFSQCHPKPPITVNQLEWCYI